MSNRSDVISKLEIKAKKLAVSFSKLAKSRINQKHQMCSKMHSTAIALRDIKSGAPFQLIDGFVVTQSTKVKLAGE